MKRRLTNMLYLVATKEKPIFNTSNIHQIINKIPCDQEEFFKLSPTQLYVLQQLSQYPQTMKQKELRMEDEVSRPEKYDDDTKLSLLLMQLPAEMDYLDVEDARQWLKQMSCDQIAKHKANLKLLESHLQQTLNQGNYESHVEHSVRMFIEQIKKAQQMVSSQVV